jgi:hypothetical protein
VINFVCWICFIILILVCCTHTFLAFFFVSLIKVGLICLNGFNDLLVLLLNYVKLFHLVVIVLSLPDS